MIEYSPRDIYFEYIETKAIERLFNGFVKAPYIPSINHNELKYELSKPINIQNFANETIIANDAKVSEVHDLSLAENEIQWDTLNWEAPKAIKDEEEIMPVFDMSKEEAVNLISTLERIKEWIKSSFLDWIPGMMKQVEDPMQEEASKSSNFANNTSASIISKFT